MSFFAQQGRMGLKEDGGQFSGISPHTPCGVVVVDDIKLLGFTSAD